MPINLPRYVFRRANGSLRYKRIVPKHLRALLGKDTLYRQLIPQMMTLERALQGYVAYKSYTPKAAREIGQQVERLRTDMQSVFGEQKLKHTPLVDIIRQDANELRDHLLGARQLPPIHPCRLYC